MHIASNRKYVIYSWATVFYMILVILWGAYVRASGSGAGCGDHWPLCNGQVLPRAPELATLIEFGHRITSGVALILIAIQWIWSFQAYPKGHAVRHGATLSAVFLLIEAALGAGLVLLELVGANDSSTRAVAVAVHLVNTFILLGCQTYAAWAATTERLVRFRFESSTARSSLVLIGLASFLVVGASGAIVALGDTLFPATTLVDGFRRDFSAASHFLIRLRVIHPVLAILASGYALFLASWVSGRDERNSVKVMARVLSLVIVTQVVLGFTNLMLLAPTWMQMVHLFVADAVWIAYILLALESLTSRRPVLAHERLHRNSQRAAADVAAPVGAPQVSPAR